MSSLSPFGGSLYGILEFLNDINASRNSKFLCDGIPRSSRGMTQDLGILELLKIRHCEALKKEGAISMNSKFILRNSKFPVIPQLCFLCHPPA